MGLSLSCNWSLRHWPGMPVYQCHKGKGTSCRDLLASKVSVVDGIKDVSERIQLDLEDMYSGLRLVWQARPLTNRSTAYDCITSTRKWSPCVQGFVAVECDHKTTGARITAGGRLTCNTCNLLLVQEEKQAPLVKSWCGMFSYCPYHQFPSWS